MRVRKLSLALGTAAAGVAVLGALPAMGADHRDAPLTTAASRLDINDLYAWVLPNGNLAVAMTVNPLTTPADTSKLMLDPDGVYEFKFDLDGDAVADVAAKITASGTGPVQDVTLRIATGADAISNAPNGTVVTTGKSSSGAGVTTIPFVDEGVPGNKLYVGPRDDPFFFDLDGLKAGLKFTGNDTFKGTNVTVILLEYDKATLAGLPTGKFGVWATTSRRGAISGWDQVDRMGRPGIATLFIPAAKKDAYNTNNPDRDVSIYTDDVKAALNSLGSPATDTLAGLLLPDILTVDTKAPTKYLNGRAPADDVIDISLQAITGNPAATDKVNANDKPFSSTFPYFADPATATAPGAPNTGSGVALESGDGSATRWTLPAGLVAGGILLATAGWLNRRRGSVKA